MRNLPGPQLRKERPGANERQDLKTSGTPIVRVLLTGTMHDRIVVHCEEKGKKGKRQRHAL